MQMDLKAMITVPNEVVAKALHMKEEELLLLYPQELIEAKRIAMKVNRFISFKRQGIEDMMPTFENDSRELPAIKNFVPNTYAEALDNITWCYNRIVRNEINEELANKFILIVDAFVVGVRMKHEFKGRANGEVTRIVNFGDTNFSFDSKS